MLVDLIRSFREKKIKKLQAENRDLEERREVANERIEAIHERIRAAKERNVAIHERIRAAKEEIRQLQEERNKEK